MFNLSLSLTIADSLLVQVRAWVLKAPCPSTSLKCSCLLASALFLWQNVEVELKPGGRNINVTNDNVVEYIHRVADYRYCSGLK